MGASDDMLPMIREYMIIWFAGAVFITTPLVGNAAIRATGDTFLVISTRSGRLCFSKRIRRFDRISALKKIMQFARDKCKTRRVEFEPVVIAGHSAGYDLTRFANSKKNKIEQVVMGSQGTGYPKGTFFGSVSNYVLHKAKVPVTIQK